ncbi:hypothetical protein [Alcanivorax sp. DP30]|uniref:hypothetical protein n=1 Tax=Alcanivorax sp. DP30 TaxID=2606217 RepID=UPI00136D3D70|nr:hypothetical protein [Alcanivorax sp. DP30]MZR61337.1 hypothetical protein [Alcanivorax sp. DP30]
MSKILKLSTLRPDTALENLNRLTGLDFQQWPESLQIEQDCAAPVSGQDEKPTREDTGQAAAQHCFLQG